MSLNMVPSFSRIRTLWTRRTVRLGLYIVVGLLCFGLVFIWTFPYAALERRIEAEASRALKRPMILEDLGYAFPWGLHFKTLSIPLPRGLTDTSLVCRDGVLRPRLRSLLAGDLGMALSWRCLGGGATGRAGLSPLFSPEAFQIRLTWEEVQLERLPVWEALPGLDQVRGFCSGNLEIAGPAGSFSPDSGSGSLRIEQAFARVLAMKDMELPLEEARGEADWILKGNRLAIEQLQMASKGLDLDMSGSVRLAKPLSRSALDLVGNLRFSKARPELYSLARRMLPSRAPKFRISGRLTQPETSFSK